MTVSESNGPGEAGRPPTPAVLYTAKSNEDTHSSIPDQLDDCRAMAEHEGWEVVRKSPSEEGFSDEGFSAYSGNRGPDLERAKRAAAEVAADRGECFLVVQHTDRLARGAGDAPGAADSLTEIWHALARQNVRIRSVQNPDATSDPVYAAIAAKVAHEDSKRKSAATRAGKRRRVTDRKGSAGPLPFGYRLVPKSDGEGKDRVRDPDEAPIVLRMFAMLDEGRSVGEITRWLNEQGARTKRGNAFGRGRVRDILTNPWYGGRMRAYGEVVESNHEGLMPWEEFERIRREADRRDPVSKQKRRGGRPSEVALLSGVLFCAHCGHGVWHRKGRTRRYVCGHVRHATGACTEAAPFDAHASEVAVLDHLAHVFLDFDGWPGGVTEHRASQRAGLVRELSALQQRGADLDRDEGLVRGDYMRQLRGGNDRAADLAIREIDRIESERAALTDSAADLEARLAEWDGRDAADAMLDFWTELSRAIRDEVVNADSVREANTALRERFAAIYVRSPKGGLPRLDFVLKEREPGAPLVSSRLWVDDEIPDDGSTLIDFIQEDPVAVQSGRSTLV